MCLAADWIIEEHAFQIRVKHVVPRFFGHVQQPGIRPLRNKVVALISIRYKSRSIYRAGAAHFL